MEQSNNRLIEQFQKEIDSQGNTLNRESWNSILVLLFRVAGATGWANISSQINNSTEKVSHKESGIQLCLFAIDRMANDIDADLKISEITLELGVECLKSLLEINIDSMRNISAEEKEKEKEVYNTAFDLWKDWMKDSLRQEGRLL